MNKRLLYILFFMCINIFLYAEKKDPLKKIYPLKADPIDVVIVSHPKDRNTLDYCIQGIKDNGALIRRVIVVSETKLTDCAEWFDEHQFPFSKDTITKVIGRGDKKKAETFFKKTGRGAGWYFQQLLKLYSAFVIPDISSNVLVIDADTLFMNPVSFINERQGGLFCVSPFPGKKPYFRHAEKLLPDYQRIYPEVYSVCHHMLFQKPILKEMFKTVENYHKKAFWIAFCNCVDVEAEKKGASEYEIYYNYALRHTDQVQIRPLIWANSAHLADWAYYKRDGYHFVSFHTYMIGKWPSIYGTQ
ncbi:DUF6492 family protein [Candidatus Protochlamydia amoebophila]|uniref:Nucleotide-diphospho-sugar transferase domain-containing protein n=1 Tax=Protochlamydia amoebophila (strain UWE25) TaxID=264201 RepID=Q6MAU4_PARUW|nr:DUF6492 family protein [Candidatus Protochlamydia amoebophila]CAF24305.1 unnamed protein product [Candidatus Protochlamydia amoebophila UWE25]